MTRRPPSITALLVLLLMLCSAFGCGGGANQQQGGGTTPERTALTPTTEVGVGQTAQISEPPQEVKVNQVQSKYTPPSGARAAQSGNQFILVDVSLTNTTNDTTTEYLPSKFSIEDSDGTLWPHTIMIQVPDALNYSGSLAPGQTVRGNIVFEVPQNGSGFKLRYQPENEIVKIDLSS